MTAAETREAFEMVMNEWLHESCLQDRTELLQKL